MNTIRYILLFILAIFFTGILASCKDDSFKRIFRKVPKAEYTRDAPDEWTGLEEEHLPVVTFYKDREPDIYVRVNLKNPSVTHHIEKIGIMDENRKDLATKEFNQNDRIFEAQFYSAHIPSDKKNLKVYAKCSLHDLWTEPFKKP
jgi:desulfoferrodoxin (superoxide reductase-like protein)